MNVSELKKYLNNLYKDVIPYKAVLIDGSWGCGKTYAINDFINSYPNVNTIYISLFGLKNVNDIVLRLYEYLNSDYIQSCNEDYYLKPQLKENEYNKTLIFFDDLERYSNQNNYDLLFGLINGLRLFGFKVVSVANSKEIKESDLFFKFREKTFDSCISVQADSTSFPYITNWDFENSNESILRSVNGNWRTIKKALDFCQAFDIKAKELQRNDVLTRMSLDRLSFARSAIYAVLMQNSVNSILPNFKGDENQEYNYNYYIDEWGYSRYEMNEYYHLLDEESENKNYIEKGLEFLPFLKNCDYEKLINKYYPLNAEGFAGEYPFNVNPFYFSDNEKQKYKKVFLQKIREFNFSNYFHADILKNFLLIFVDKLTEDEQDLIIQRISETIGGIDDTFFVWFRMPISKKQNEIDLFYRRVRQKYSDKESSLLKKDLVVNCNNYESLFSFLFSKKYASEDYRNEVANLLQRENYYFPNLAETIDPEIWAYCHELTSFMCGTKYCDDFKRFLDSKKYTSDSETEKERLTTLLEKLN